MHATDATPEARLVNHRGKWAVRHNGRRYSLGIDFSKRNEAEAKRLRAVWLKALKVPVQQNITALTNAYIKDLKADDKSWERVHYAHKHLEPVFGHLTPDLIDKDMQRDYIARRQKAGAAPDTIRTEMNALRRTMNWAVREKHISADQKPHIIMPPASPPRDHWLTRDEFQTVLAAAKTDHVRLFIILAITTAARKEALLQLTWSRVDMERREIDLRKLDDGRQRKGRAVVPINDNLFDALTEAQERAETAHVIEYGGKPLANLRRPLERMKAATGIYVTAHMFRHSAAVWMAQDNIPIQKIAEYLGHSDISVTYKHYARYYPDHLRDAADVLTW